MMLMKDRYEHDPAFRAMVDQLVWAIEQGHITPTEAREAAMLAQLMYEERNPRPIIFTREDIIRGRV